MNVAIKLEYGDRDRMPVTKDGYEGFIAALCENVPECCWDEDAAVESVLVDYVRALERVATGVRGVPGPGVKCLCWDIVQSQQSELLPGPLVPADWECDEHVSYAACCLAGPHFMRD